VELFPRQPLFPPRAPSHPAKRPFNPNISSRHASRSEDPRARALVFPNGRNPYNKTNGLAIQTLTNSSFTSSSQAQQNLSSPNTEDLLATIKRCFDDLIQPFYCALVEKLLHCREDQGLPYSISEWLYQSSTFPPNVFTESPRYSSETSQPYQFSTFPPNAFTESPRYSSETSQP